MKSLISEIELEGETIKKVLTVTRNIKQSTGNVISVDITYLVFESGKVVVLPITSDLKIQHGTIQDLLSGKDFEEMLEEIKIRRLKTNLELDKTEKEIRGIFTWAGQKLIP